MNKLVKLLTLSLFVGLLFAFVAYRSGYIRLPATHVSATQTELVIPGDTIDSLQRFEIMSSSKTIILREHLIPQRDSTFKCPATTWIISCIDWIT